MLSSKIGILGGGQLGRMLQEKALEWGVALQFLDPDSNCSCRVFEGALKVGNYRNYEDVLKFGKNLDILAIEIEHVNADALEELEKEGKKVFPSASTIKLIQNKALQKEFYKKNNIPTADFIIGEKARLSEIEKEFLPAFQKTQRDGYDGKGVLWLTSENLDDQLNAPFILEKKAKIQKELAITYAQTTNGDVYTYPICEMVFSDSLNLVEYLIAPAQIDNEIENKINTITLKIANTLNSAGVFSIEFFLTSDGQILVNEMAPRAHNSAHYTIEGCNISQFEAQLRVMLQMPMQPISIRKNASMINLIGEEGYEGIPKIEGLESFSLSDEAHLHLYGKLTTRPGRKMGHITLLNEDIEALKLQTQKIKNQVKIKA